MRVLIFLIALVISFDSFGQEINLTGVNKGEGLYIKNPYNYKTDSFCIQQLYVNGRRSNANLRLTAIKLNFNEVDKFAPVHVKVIHGDSCQPKIVNPQAILYYTSFKFDSLVINDSLMHWYTKGDKREGMFYIERLKYMNWEELHSMKAKGRFDGAQYVYFPEHNDGGNKYRIRYELPNGRYLYSTEVEHYHYPEGVSFSPRVVTDIMYLSREARFEISDSNGEIILTGVAKKIPLRKLRSGDYTINIEGDIDSFVKK
ncbi:MAG: hypothetical protein OCD76_14660 [Reichenbachiella sp.]